MYKRTSVNNEVNQSFNDLKDKLSLTSHSKTKEIADNERDLFQILGKKKI